MEILYRPSKWGAEFHALTHDEALGAGAAGPGKTTVLIAEPLYQIKVEHVRCENPKSETNPYPLEWGMSVGWALYLRRTFPMLQQTIVRASRIFKRIDPGVAFNVKENTFVFSSGYRYQFGQCAVRGTKILMADGAAVAIEDVRVGAMVQTLEGPRRVTHTHETGYKPCVEMSVFYRGAYVGKSVHPTTHRVLTSPSDGLTAEQSRCPPQTSSRSPAIGYAWQDYESLACAGRDALETSERAVAGGVSSRLVALPDMSPASSQPPGELSTSVMLHGPTLRRALRSRGNDALYEHSHSGKPTGSQASYSSRPHPHDGQPPGAVVDGRGLVLLRGGAESSTDDSSCDGPSSYTQQYSPGSLGESYPHPYSGENRTRTEDVRMATGVTRTCGNVQTYDLTVAEVNHYILADTGIVSQNCQHVGDWENYYSNEYTKILFDELNAFEKEQYDQIGSRCRTDDPVLDLMCNVRSMSNPVQRLEKGQKTSVSDPYWVRKMFVDPAPLGRVTIKRNLEMEDGTTEIHRRIYLPAKLWDNPNKKFVRSYEKTLRGKPRHIRKALLEGDWYSVAGGFFEESWDPRMHICRPFRIPTDWPQMRAMDWGYKKPGCVGWYAMDPDGNLFKHREFNFKGLDARQCAEEVKKIEEGMGLWHRGRSRISGPADNQLWENRGDVGRSKAAEQQAVGVGWVKADKKSRQRNAERIVNRFKDHQNGTTTPGLVIFSSCVMTIRTLPMIATSPVNAEEPHDGGQDHWLDETGYACAHASNGRSGLSMITEDDDEFEDEADYEEDRGQLGYGNALL